MRKLKLQVQMSIDGYIGGPNNEMDWMEWNWDDALKNFVMQFTEPVDCILMGRKLAEGFIPHWTNALKDPATNDEFARKMVETPKVVFSKSIEKSIWENTVVNKGRLKEEVEALKKQNGKDLIVYGGAQFVSGLIEEELIDDLHLFVNPAAIGKGLPIFKSIKKFKLVNSQSYACGIVVLHYQPLK